MPSHPEMSFDRAGLATVILAAACCWCVPVNRVAAADPAFAEPPSVTRDGDTVTIVFAVREFCDVTAAIEAPGQVIVRHLASGVLGENAPPPFQRNARRQTILWDGKRDDGTYVDNVNGLTVRVSLGLAAAFERRVIASPYKPLADISAALAPPLIRAAPEGVYVYDAGGTTHQVRLYSHAGDYVRTVYPFPADRMDRVRGLMWAQDGQPAFARKHGAAQSTLLTSGLLAHGKTWPSPGTAAAASAMIVHGERLLLVRQRLNRLPLTETGGDLPLTGPPTGIAREGPDGVDIKCPRDAALSPDGQWLYLTGFSPTTPYWGRGVLHAVMRMNPAAADEPQLFAGALTDEPGSPGDNTRFNTPASVACDSHERVYVADYLNDRIQVFGSDGVFLTSVPIPRPALLRIHPQTGELYVFSWFFFNSQERPPERGQAHLTRLESLPTSLAKTVSAPNVLARQVIGDLASAYGRVAVADVDFHTEPPVIWFAVNRGVAGRAKMAPGERGKFILDMSIDDAERGIQLLRADTNGLVTIGRLNDRVPPALAHFNFGSPVEMAVDPATGDLYAGSGADGFTACLQLRAPRETPATVQLPFRVLDMAFHPKGYAYLRSGHNRAGDVIARFAPRRWNEIPFDYGNAAPEGLPALLAAAVMPGSTLHPLRGGMGVSPRGRLAVAWVHAPNVEEEDSEGKRNKNRHVFEPKPYSGRPDLRSGNQIVRILNLNGQTLFEDAFPGIPGAQHLAMDKDDNLYVLLDAGPVRQAGRYRNPMAGTLVKVRAGHARIISDDALAPLPVTELTRPGRPPDIEGPPLGRAWIDHAAWQFSGCGLKSGPGGRRSNFALDLYGRSFVPRTDRYDLIVLDRNGNPMLRIGRYGNADDAASPDRGTIATHTPQTKRTTLTASATAATPTDDGVALFHPTQVAVHTDRRLYIADPGNAQIVSVRLSYRATATIALRSDETATPQVSLPLLLSPQ